MKVIVAGLLMLVLAMDVIAQETRDPSNFGDEDEAILSWTEDLKDQAVDLTMFTAFATLALVSFFRKSERLKWITMAAAVLYLGFARSSVCNFHGGDHHPVGPFVLRPHLRLRRNDTTSR